MITIPARLDDRAARWALGLLVAFALQVGLPLAALAGPVDVNSADAPTLARELKGIGLAKAQAIVAHRDKHGPFRRLEDLGRVRGIGAKTLERNRDAIRLGAGAAAARAPAGGPSARVPAPVRAAPAGP